MPAAPPVQLAPGANTPTGEVRFVVDGQQPGVLVPLAGLGASLLFSEATPGTHTVEAFFADYPDFSTEAASPPLTLPFSAGPDGTSITAPLTVTPAAPSFGQSVTLTAQVNDTNPDSMATPDGGFVYFSDNGRQIGAARLVAGAVYSGNAVYATSTSSTVSTSTAQARTSMRLTTSSKTPQFGDTVTLTATLWAVKPATGIPSGTVTFLDGTSALGTASLVDGVASFSTSALAVGGHSITAVYGGDDNFLTGKSAALAETVVQAQVVVQLSATPATASAGTSITFSVTVAPANGGSVAPTGTVTLFDGTKQIGTMTLSNGAATLTFSSLKKGTHPITAVYGGDSDFLGGTSTVVQVTIN